METGFLCPHDLKLFNKPRTLHPCGHTYCASCVEALKDSNFNKIECTVCDIPVVEVFENKQLESLVEQFAQRKLLTMGFLKWVKAFSGGESLEGDYRGE